MDFGSKKIPLCVCSVSGFGKAVGLMFSRPENAKALLFDFKKPAKIPIHSFFVFFPLLAVWLDGKNKIIESKIVYPFRFSISPEGFFSKIIEIPVNRRYEKIIKILVGNRKI